MLLQCQLLESLIRSSPRGSLVERRVECDGERSIPRGESAKFTSRAGSSNIVVRSQSNCLLNVYESGFVILCGLLDIFI